ncbi:unnamed protein product [Zymoseptoria tritici ST99CH_1A5]|uniref:Uncharacterized protein n=1 Tax=Zymoseptoria tritici ST99CH_1A5 TaxID=1276529 RepID=A0A1Y6LBB9_ZYMTR|nr:unnamed protein product [Zymoseptoria tritici ST99CH_1A5]
MQIKYLLCACAFAALSSAQIAYPLNEGEQNSYDLERSSIISVLSTALPASLLEFNTEYGASGIWNAANHDIFTATQGHDGPDLTKYFPEWVTALPSDVQTYLDVDLAEPTVTTYTATSFVGYPVAWDEDLEDEEIASVGSVLATAVPASIDGLASTDPWAYQSAFEVEFEPDGTYADWVTALPSDVQTMLIPGGIHPPTPATVTVITVTSTVGKQATLSFAQGTPNTEGELPSLTP